MDNDLSLALLLQQEELTQMEEDRAFALLIQEEEKLIGVSYKFRIDSITYEEDKNNKNRLNAIKKICNLRKNKNEKSDNVKKVLKPGIPIIHHL